MRRLGGMTAVKRARKMTGITARKLLFYSRFLRTGRLPEFDMQERMLGIMMIRNENDILRETLKNITLYYDRIFVLDGTEPDGEFLAGRRIMDEFEEVKLVMRDSDTKGPFPIRDGARFYLLEEVRKRYGVNNWIGVLHGDEMYTRDPRPFLKMINPRLMPVVTVRLCHFFLHTTDRENWSEIAGAPVEDRVTHYMWPGDWENRFFFDTGKFQYDPACHGIVIPYPHAFKKRLDNFVVKQYNYRTPEQMLARAAQRIKSKWQKNHYEHIKKEGLFFVDSLHVPGYDPCGALNLRIVDERKRSKPKSIKSDPLLPGRPMARPVFVGGICTTDAEHVTSLMCGRGELAGIRGNTEFLTADNGLLEVMSGTHKNSYRQLLETLSRLNWIVSPLRELGDRCCGLELKYLARLLSDSEFSLRHKENAVRELVHFLFDRVAAAENAVGWIEHSPSNIFRASQLLEMFEDGYFICVMRDPAEVVKSFYSGFTKSAGGAFDLYKQRYDRWLQSCKLIKSGPARERLIEINFGNVISSQGRNVQHILKRMGISAGEEKSGTF